MWLLSSIFTNSRLILFTCATLLSRSHSRHSCPPSFSYLSSLLSLLTPVSDLDPECSMNCHKIGILLGSHNSVSVGSGWGSTFVATCFWEERARATQVLSGGRKVTYGRTQSLYVLRHFARYFRSQHALYSEMNLISYMLSRKIEDCWFVLFVI
jgi:hypothetical protein